MIEIKDFKTNYTDICDICDNVKFSIEVIPQYADMQPMTICIDCMKEMLLKMILETR